MFTATLNKLFQMRVYIEGLKFQGSLPHVLGYTEKNTPVIHIYTLAITNCHLGEGQLILLTITAEYSS